jgi:hypothetical protein
MDIVNNQIYIYINTLTFGQIFVFLFCFFNIVYFFGQNFLSSS